jgi:Na+(H+)/acetate symporter ActP
MVNECFVGGSRIVGFHGWFMDGSWLSNESFVWMVQGWFMDGSWIIHGWFVDGSWIGHG